MRWTMCWGAQRPRHHQGAPSLLRALHHQGLGKPKLLSTKLQKWLHYWLILLISDSYLKSIATFAYFSLSRVSLVYLSRFSHFPRSRDFAVPQEPYLHGDSGRLILEFENYLRPRSVDVERSKCRPLLLLFLLLMCLMCFLLLLFAQLPVQSCEWCPRMSNNAAQ